MFGYATDETEECMPLTIVLAHKLNAKLAELRRDGTLPWLRPDSKTQVRTEEVSVYLGPSLQGMACIGLNKAGINYSLETQCDPGSAMSRMQRV